MTGLATSAETYRNHTLVTLDVARGDKHCDSCACYSVTTETRIYDAAGKYVATADTSKIACLLIDGWADGSAAWEG